MQSVRRLFTQFVVSLKLSTLFASLLLYSLVVVAASDHKRTHICTKKEGDRTTAGPQQDAVAPSSTSALRASLTSQLDLSSNTVVPTVGPYSNVDITVYDNDGSYGACSTKLYDNDTIVALAKPTWGQSTYNIMTGRATNPWCGQKIQIQYNSRFVEATVMDLCPSCVGHDIDLSLAAWNELTGNIEKTRLKGSWIKLT